MPKAPAILALPLIATVQISAADPASLCADAARQVAQETGVTLDRLRQLAAGHDASENQGWPWPWTVRTQGRAVTFDTEAEALSHLFDRFRKGDRTFAVGCFQLRYDRHGPAFDTVEQMTDPIANARVAAAELARGSNVLAESRAVTTGEDRADGVSRIANSPGSLMPRNGLLARAGG